MIRCILYAVSVTCICHVTSLTRQTHSQTGQRELSNYDCNQIFKGCVREDAS